MNNGQVKLTTFRVSFVNSMPLSTVYTNAMSAAPPDSWLFLTHFSIPHSGVLSTSMDAHTFGLRSHEWLLQVVPNYHLITSTIGSINGSV